MARTSIGIFPAAWAASVCRRAPCVCTIAPIAASGWMVPISLFAAMTLTRMVRGVIAARSASRSTRPPVSTPSTVTSSPCCRNCRQTSRTDLCSVATVTIWSPRDRSASTAPLSARLLDSVAPLVKVISPAVALMSAATCARARSVASRASQPNACCLLWGLPNRSVKNGSIASRTRGSTGVVAW